MAHTAGTATDYLDLLDKLRLYLVAQGWTQLNFTGGDTLHIRGDGAGAGREVYLEIRAVADAPSGYYAWRAKGATAYVSGAAEGLQPGSFSTTDAYFNLSNGTIDYWFFVNDRRVIVVAKIGSVYVSAHYGFFLPFATPEQYPFPLYVAGNYGLLETPNEANSANRFFIDPGGSLTTRRSAYMRDPSGLWQSVVNQVYSGANDNSLQTGQGPSCFVYPAQMGEVGTSASYLGWTIGASINGAAGGGSQDSFVPTAQNEHALWPVSLHSRAGPPYGSLDGVYMIFGTGLSSEQLITIGSREFMVFQNIGRSSSNDFMAVERI